MIHLPLLPTLRSRPPPILVHCLVLSPSTTCQSLYLYPVKCPTPHDGHSPGWFFVLHIFSYIYHSGLPKHREGDGEEEEEAVRPCLFASKRGWCVLFFLSIITELTGGMLFIPPACLFLKNCLLYVKMKSIFVVMLWGIKSDCETEKKKNKFLQTARLTLLSNTCK